MLNIKTSVAICEDFKEELAKLIPDIIRHCLTGNEIMEAEYGKRIELILDKTFRYVSDFKFVLEWMGMNADFLNQPPYNQNGGYSWISTFQTIKNQEECRRILDWIVNKIIEVDCNSSVKKYNREKDSIGHGMITPY